MALSKSLVRKAGLHYVLFRLAQLGWDAEEHSPRGRGVNIVATRDGSGPVTIRLNSLSGRDAAKQGEELADVVADYVIVCRYVGREVPECFVLTREEVLRVAECNGEGAGRNCWLQVRDYESPDHRERWEKLRPVWAGG